MPRKARHSRTFGGHWGAGKDVRSAGRLIREIERGFAYSVIVRLEKSSGMPAASIARWVGIPPRTLVRRKAAGRFRAAESERLERFSRLIGSATGLFEGDTTAARRWLESPRRELEGRTPLEFGLTEVGARVVEELIGRLEQGVFT